MVRAERMSLTISSAERESFHFPGKRLAQPFLCEAVCSLATVMELLSRAISSIFSVLLRSFRTGQIRALVGDVTFKPFMLIYILACYSAAKLSIFSESANKNPDNYVWTTIKISASLRSTCAVICSARINNRNWRSLTSWHRIRVKYFGVSVFSSTFAASKPQQL